MRCFDPSTADLDHELMSCTTEDAGGGRMVSLMSICDVTST